MPGTDGQDDGAAPGPAAGPAGAPGPDDGTGFVDISVPSVARMYDDLLGGRDNFPVDRAANKELLAQVPSMRNLALQNRQFLRRVVRVLAREYGVRQFIDHGSGLPTRDNVHEVAQRVDPSCRVVYIDNDPIVRNIGGAMLERNENTAVLRADLRDTAAVFGDPQVRRLIDPREPVAALFVSVLHCIPEADDPKGLVARVRDRLPDGSFLVVCQLVSDDPRIRDFVTRYMAEQTHGAWGRVREKADVRGYFEGLDIQAPGLVEVSTWRPDADRVPAQETFEWEEYGGLGRVVR
ncbi:SAM-dependent methyltransferase [Streptomyces sp. NPDC047002]|uniref:SAM-dependent methyltransferase n=1 Tax=Streptomyces sp. NPDC047002 TaxID=3155475 RepID=UPI0034515981